MNQYDTIPFQGDPDQPGIPLKGLHYSEYPIKNVKEGMRVFLRHNPIETHPHAVAFVDEAGKRIGWVPDNLALTLWEGVRDGLFLYGLQISHVRVDRYTGTEAWVGGVLYVPQTS